MEQPEGVESDEAKAVAGSVSTALQYLDVSTFELRSRIAF
jgi:hypothetical protein